MFVQPENSSVTNNGLPGIIQSKPLLHHLHNMRETRLVTFEVASALMCCDDSDCDALDELVPTTVACAEGSELFPEQR